ncbi:MAG TPA: fasciclin domain-containing protein [Polyangiaceae bacterium LLY-WYZ-14_1]|nr:fasciclin domain-containing protein [Polyangiaceae bacterium LLY-WYZ-14_1]
MLLAAGSLLLGGCTKNLRTLEGERYTCDCSVVTEEDCNPELMLDLMGSVSGAATCGAGTVTRFFRDVLACSPVLVEDPEAYCRTACIQRGRDRLGRQRRGTFLSADVIAGSAAHLGAGQCTDGDGGPYVYPAITDEDVRRGRIQREFSTMSVSIDHPEIRGTAAGLYIEDTEVNIRGARCSDPTSIEPFCDLFITMFSVRAGWEEPTDGPFASVPFRIDGARISDFGFRLSGEVKGNVDTGTPDEWIATEEMNLELGGRIRKDVGLMGRTVRINIGEDGDDPGEPISFDEPQGEIETDLGAALQYMTLVASFEDTRRRSGEDVTLGIELDALIKFFSGSPVANFEFIRERRPPAFMMSMGGLPDEEPMWFEPEPQRQDGQNAPAGPTPDQDEPGWDGPFPFEATPDAPGMGARMMSTAGSSDAWMVLDGSGSDPFPGMPIDEYRWYYRNSGVLPEIVLLFGLGPRVPIMERDFDEILADPDQTICLLVVGEDGLRSEKCLGEGVSSVDVPIEPRIICNELATTAPRASLFRQAVREASAISAPTNGHTWFVPTDDAIEADIGLDRFNRIFEPENQAELERFVRSHVYPNVVRRADIAASLGGVPSEAGDEGDLSSAEKEAAVFDADIPCDGGILHGVASTFYAPAL